MAGWFALTVADLPPLDGPDSEAAAAACSQCSRRRHARLRRQRARYWQIFRHTGSSCRRGDGVLHPPRGGDDRRRADGRAGMARELVGMARADRQRVPDHRRRGAARMAGRALPATSTCRRRASDGRTSACSSATWWASRRTRSVRLRPGGRRARRLLEHRGAAAHTSLSADEIEKFIGDGIVATFNGRDDQPDHALRAAQAALALQRELARLAIEHPDWPQMRIGVNSGEAVLREVGGEGHVAIRSSATPSTPERGWRASHRPAAC